ncbi:MAG TPA: hypothetical protein VF911_15065 [Thermoanaerobaculia bacterium]|jgi:antitoxin component of MazEF toxin-antitoxin module
MRRLVIAVLLLLFASPLAHAQYPDPDYERILLPTFWFGGGAGGSQWWSGFDLVSTESSFDLGGLPVLKDVSACPFFCPCEAKTHVERGKAENICEKFEDSSGMLLWVPRSVSPQTVHTSLRVYDRSREGERAGTQIPVVWERDLYSGTIVLLDVKTEPRYRSAVRVYDAFLIETDFVFRFYDMAKYRAGDRELLLETVVRARAGRPSGPPRFPLHPAIAAIPNIVAEWPQLASVQSVAIEVTGTHAIVSPPQYDKRFYALATITNNTTHEVTAVAPR